MVFRHISIVLLFAAAVPLLHGADDGVRLSYRFPVHGVYHYDASSTMTQRFSMMERPMESSVTTDLELRVSVLDKVMQSSTVDIQYDYGRIRTRLEGMEDVPVQDTSVEIDAIKDLRLRLHVQPTGEITNTEIIAAHEASIEIMNMLRSTRIFDRLFTTFPSFDVSPGDSWTVPVLDTTIAPQGLGLVITDGAMKLVYRGVKDTLGVTCWVVDASSTNLQQFGEFQRGEVRMDLDGGGKITGRIFHDVTTGAVVTSQSEIVSTVTMRFSGPQKTQVPVETNIVLDLHQPFPLK